jgi:sugar/nucleoside kinase (ribokinase family)
MRMNPRSLVIYGDVSADVLVRTESVPKPGEDAVVDSLSFLPGGSGANCAAVAAKLGAHVKFLGLTGRDAFGAMLIRDLARHGVDVRQVRRVDGPTAMIVIIVDKNGERTFLSSRGAAATVDYGPLGRSFLRRGDILHLSGYCFQTPQSRQTALALLSIACSVGAQVSVDPSFSFARNASDSFSGVLGVLDFLFPNEKEAVSITGTPEPSRAADRLLRLGIKTVVLKLGADGCLVKSADLDLRVPSYPIPAVVDTTGAGDAFAGGFLAAVLKNCTLEEAACVGHAAAAMVIGEMGGHTAAPSISQLKAFARQQHDKRLRTGLGRFRSPKRRPTSPSRPR